MSRMVQLRTSDAAVILAELEALGRPENVAGMARYGIRSAKALGVPGPVLRATAKRIGRDHDLALALWETGVLEARALGCLIDDPAQVSRRQMQRWAGQFDSWAVCDCACGTLFDRTPFAIEKARAWSRARGEYVKRAGFVLMAALAVHDRRAPDELFLEFLSIVEEQAADGRNMVKKGVNWALRQIGKRNLVLHSAALRSCRRLRETGEPAARWVAADALRELNDERTLERIKRKSSRSPARTR
jgi:3-methyladenine DNA glycosylase AlkD